MKFLLITLFLLSAVFLLPDFASADVTFLSVQSSAADASSYTFSAVDLGAAAGDRYIIISCSALSSSRNITTVTIGGVAVTEFSITGIDTFNIMGYANVPTGTTGDVVVTLDAGGTSAGCGLYRVTGLFSTTDDSQDHDATAGSSTLNLTTVVAGTQTAFVIAHVMQVNSDSTSGTWTELTEQYDTNTEAPNGLYLHGAFKTYAAGSTIEAVSTPSNSNTQRGYAVALRYTAGGGGGAVPIEIIWFE